MRLREVVFSIFLPLAAMLTYLTLQGKGFPSLWPVAASTIYAFVQPVLQYFVLDEVRGSLVANGKGQYYLMGVATACSALAVGIARIII